MEFKQNPSSFVVVHTDFGALRIRTPLGYLLIPLAPIIQFLLYSPLLRSIHLSKKKRKLLLNRMSALLSSLLHTFARLLDRL